MWLHHISKHVTYQPIIKETSAQVSSCEIHEAFQNSIVIEHLRNSVSDVSTILATNLNTFPTTNPFVPSAPFSTP